MSFHFLGKIIVFSVISSQNTQFYPMEIGCAPCVAAVGSHDGVVYTDGF